MDVPKLGHIPLSGQNGQGFYAIVDPELVPVLTQNNRSWHKHSEGYAASRNELMQRVIYAYYYGPESIVGLKVDHRNGDRLHNVKSNLRIATAKINAKNRTTKGEDQEFEGVYPTSDGNFCCKLKDIIIYVSSDERACAFCYDSVVTFVYGEGKRLNDNKSHTPIAMESWNLSKDVIDKLIKLKNCHSDYHGVKYSRGTWKSKITIDLGRYETALEAANAYDIASQLLNVDLPLNNPDQKYSVQDARMILSRIFTQEISSNGLKLLDNISLIETLKPTEIKPPDVKPSVKKLTQPQLNENTKKSLQTFIEQECNLGSNLKIKTSEFNNTFTEWCQKNGILTTRAKDVRIIMKTIGYPFKKSSIDRYHGIDLKYNLKNL